MLTDEVWYEAGDGCRFRRTRPRLLITGQLDAEASAALWQTIRTVDDFHDLVDALTTIGLRKLESVGLIHVDGTVVRLLVRNRVNAVVHAEFGPPEAVTAAGAVTWVERSVENPRALELRIDQVEPRALYPFGSGVVRASWIRVGEKSEDLATASREDPGLVEIKGRHAASGSGHLPEDPSIPAPDVEGDVEYTLMSFDSEFELEGTAAPFPQAVELSASELSLEEPEPEPDDEFDDLFGATKFRAVEAAAVRPEEEKAALVDPPASKALDETMFFSPAPPGAPTAPVEPPSTVVGQLIDGVPGVSGSTLPVEELAQTSEQNSPPVSAFEDAEADSLTISRSQMLKLKGSASSETKSVPEVHGIWCDMRHPNPPHATICRICKSELPSIEPVTIPRPVLGILRFSDGTETLLDRPIIIGRSPRAERVTGQEIPQLVSLPSPDQNISRNHLEIRIDGWHVLVVDLQSINGTVVTNPGQPAELLRAGEEVLIVPGTTVSLADEISFVYEVIE